uniref:Kinesin motor domain-containing protein n=1 Tax=Felis catus TaxID=9685 RepID=A0ABI7Z6U6_FELCA
PRLGNSDTEKCTRSSSSSAPSSTIFPGRRDCAGLGGRLETKRGGADCRREHTARSRRTCTAAVVSAALRRKLRCPASWCERSLLSLAFPTVLSRLPLPQSFWINLSHLPPFRSGPDLTRVSTQGRGLHFRHYPTLPESAETVRCHGGYVHSSAAANAGLRSLLLQRSRGGRASASGASIDIHLKKDTRRGVVNNQQTDWSFKLDGVLHNASQDLVYETVAKDVVAQALDGYNGNLVN